MNKEEARRYGLHARSLLSIEERHRQSEAVFQKIIPLLKKADWVGCYVSMKDEMETDSIMQFCLHEHIHFCVPKTEGHTLRFYEIESEKELKQGCYGVREPYRGIRTEPEKINLMIVPLSSFDAEGHRTGYGKGYYDSILPRCTRKTGIAFIEQRVDCIETDPWDVSLDEIITADR
jgi:5-formyltetrahydrofolate cyclo-ligase